MVSSTATAAPSPVRPGRGWLFGPVPDLLLGCGIGYALLFVVMMFAGASFRAAIPFGLAPLVALAAGTPHYGATLLRVYGRREDRRAYTLFAVWASLVVAAVFVWGTRDLFVGSLLLTLYLTWSPWHYTGQNYGIALMLLGRRGVSVDRTTKRWTYASFMLSYLLTVVAIHGAAPGVDYAPLQYQGSEYAFLPLGIRDPGGVLLGAAAAGWLGATAVALGRLMRRGSLGQISPAILVVATQALWFSVPVVARTAGLLQGVEPLSRQYAAYSFLWIAVGHSVQYLWVTTYYARARGDWNGTGHYLLRCLLAGALIWAIPALLFAPGALGRLPYDVGLAVLVTAAVNVHHFILDGAIWKLRDGRVARILMRTSPESEPEPEGRSPLRWFVWATGAACVGVLLFGALGEEFGLRRALAAGDRARVEAAVRGLPWLGRDGPALRTGAGILAGRAGDLEGAKEHLERSLELHPTDGAWGALAWVHLRAEESARAIGDYRAALELNPNNTNAANNLAWLLSVHENPVVRSPREALMLAEGVARVRGEDDPYALDTLAAANAAAGNTARAAELADRALRIAREDPTAAALAPGLDERLALYRAGRAYRADDARLAADAKDQAPSLTFLDSEGRTLKTIEISDG
ncbi:MAG: tetratricopeptide repeat protein [Myxococcota bacterium]